jgi:hypothetical protein
MRRRLGMAGGLVALGAALAFGGAQPASAATVTISSVSVAGTPAAPTITVNGTNFGTAPAASPATAPCGGTNQGLDYGSSLYLADSNAVLGSYNAWGAGRYDTVEGDCIGLNLLSWTATKVTYSLGAFYDGSAYQLTQGDVITVGVKGKTLKTKVAYSPASPQLPAQTWCDPSQFSCASAYLDADHTESSASLVQPVTPTHLGRYTYAALTWNGGYTGIQNDGNSVSGVVGPTAVFSLGGTGVQISSATAATCQPGFDTGAGASCRIPLPSPITDGTKYVYKVTRAANGWITGKVTLPSGTTLTIGSLLPGPGAPASLSGVSNFLEYFGPAVASRTQVPASSVQFGKAIAGIREMSASRLLGTCATVANNGSGLPILSLGGAGC